MKEFIFKIKRHLTFKDVFNALDSYQDVYRLLGVGDSIVRERVFEKLSVIMQVDYGYIYEQWLKQFELKTTF